MSFGRKLLIVEDCTNDLFFLERAFQKTGLLARSEHAATARDAVSMLQNCGSSDLPDLIVSDTNLPGMTGVEFMRWIRSSPHCRKIQVVVISGSLAPGKIADLKHAGADAVYEKPHDLIEWSNLAERVMRLNCASHTREMDVTEETPE